MEPFLRLVEAMGGGLTAVVIAALGYGNWIQYRRGNQMQDKLLQWSEESRDREGEMVEKMLTAQHNTTTAIASQGEVMRQAVRLLEGRG